ncbi:MAG: hypothetical protein QW324_04785 [Thermofilaceae archaeon]
MTPLLVRLVQLLRAVARRLPGALLRTARVLGAVGAWYYRRRGLTRALLMFLLFLPLILHALSTTRELAVTSPEEVQRRLQEELEGAVGDLRRVNCADVLGERVHVHVAGAFSYSDCFEVNTARYLYRTGLVYGVIVVLHSGPGNETYVLVLPHEAREGNVRVSHLALLARVNSTEEANALFSQAISEMNLSNVFCSLYAPGHRYSGFTVPRALYTSLCNRR